MFMDYAAIEKALEEMKPRSKLFGLIKAEMKRRGHWKNKPRGRQFGNGHDARRKKQ
jgi:hypothetical protein